MNKQWLPHTKHSLYSTHTQCSVINTAYTHTRCSIIYHQQSQIINNSLYMLRLLISNGAVLHQRNVAVARTLVSADLRLKRPDLNVSDHEVFLRREQIVLERRTRLCSAVPQILVQPQSKLPPAINIHSMLTLLSSIGYAEWHPLASPPEVCQSFREVLSTLRSVGASALGVC